MTHHSEGAINYCPEHGDLLYRPGDGADARSYRCREGHPIGEIREVYGEGDAAERLSLLLWNLTGGRLSKSTYDVKTMESEIEFTLQREWVAESESGNHMRRAQSLESAIREALNYRSVLPAIATTPRKILEDAL